MQRVLEEYAASGLKRREFCQLRDIAVTTFDYWRREHRIKAEQVERRPRLVKVEVVEGGCSGQFILSLANGRRIESTWSYSDVELARLIRIVESA
jgi:hypothetical protein